MRVKICGITSLRDLQMAMEAGADAVGFIVNVPGSPRNLNLHKAEELVKATPVFVQTVAVTVTDDPEDLRRIEETLHPSAVQVHAMRKEYGEMRHALSNTQIIGAIRVGPDLTVEAVKGMVEGFDALLVDSYSAGKYGGTGETHDWRFSRHIREATYPKPLILAGGLNPENVREAIDTVEPYAVDVSSGVESSPGRKDREKIFRFIEKVEGA